MASTRFVEMNEPAGFDVLSSIRRISYSKSFDDSTAAPKDRRASLSGWKKLRASISMKPKTIASQSGEATSADFERYLSQIIFLQLCYTVQIDYSLGY